MKVMYLLELSVILFTVWLIEHGHVWYSNQPHQFSIMIVY